MEKSAIKRFIQLRPNRNNICGGHFVCLVVLVLTLPFAGACNASATGASIPRDRDTSQNAKNLTALTAAQNNIEKYRKGPARIKVVDSRGRPAANARLDVRQLSHAFKFGCYLKIDDLDQAKLQEYERRFKSLFNYAVIGTYWDNTENKQGIENWSWFEREAALSSKLGLGIQAAPILWGTSEFGTPGWLPRRKNELFPILEQRVRSSVTRNADVADWEIVNEPLAKKKDVFAQAGMEEYIASAFRWAKDAAPTKRFLINEYGIFGSVDDHNYNSDRYFKLVDQLIRKGVPIDVIGIQAHANGEWYEPSNVAAQLDHYAALGKPIQITEFSAQTFDFNDGRSSLAISGTYRSGVWDAEKQAAFYREFYTIAFGSPQVEAIVTWGLDDERAWLPGIGLIDKNGDPKLAYRALDRLINKDWKTRISAVSNSEGVYDLRGFYGKYEVTVTTSAGETVRSEFTLANGKTDVWVIRIGI